MVKNHFLTSVIPLQTTDRPNQYAGVGRYFAFLRSSKLLTFVRRKSKLHLYDFFEAIVFRFIRWWSDIFTDRIATLFITTCVQACGVRFSKSFKKDVGRYQNITFTTPLSP